MSDRQVCGKYVEGFGSVMSYPCEEFEGHRGPCSTSEVPVSVTRRERWLSSDKLAAQEQPQEEMPPPEVRGDPPGPSPAQRASQRLAEFQGEAQTTAQRYTENPTPAPGQPDPEPRWDADEDGRCLWKRAGGHQCVLAAGHTEPHTDVADIPEFRRDAPPEPTKQRDGDQSLPETNEHPPIQDLLIADIEERKRLGRERYGTLLQGFNGRDTLQDAYEEALDLAIYLRSVQYAAQRSRDGLVEEVRQLIVDQTKATTLDGETVAAALSAPIVDHLIHAGAIRPPEEP